LTAFLTSSNFGHQLPTCLRSSTAASWRTYDGQAWRGNVRVNEAILSAFLHSTRVNIRLIQIVASVCCRTVSSHNEGGSYTVTRLPDRCLNCPLLPLNKIRQVVMSCV
jgi:hypothetical protein